MANQRIFYLPPRLLGPIDQWSGLNSPDGESPVIREAKDMGFNAVWPSPFQQTSSVPTHKNGVVKTHSLYAIRDHFTFDPEFSAGKGREEDNRHLRHFTAEAKKAGMRVYADLVFNHVASDHAAVLRENAEVAELRRAHAGHGLHALRAHNGDVIGMEWNDGGKKQNYMFKFMRTADTFEVCNIGGGTGYDTAQVNFESPAAFDFFVKGKDGQKGYYKQVIDWFVDNGFDSFRCDIAYKVSPKWWSEIISYAHTRQPDTLFMAETLGGPDRAIEDMSRVQIAKDGACRPGFDLGMLGTYWWNFEADWLPRGEHPRILNMSRFGGAGSPDNHDTETLAAGLRRQFNHYANSDELIARASVRDYAVAALACNSVYMQMGYEFCNEKESGVFSGEVSPKDWQDLTARAGSALDIRSRIRGINQLKESLEVENCYIDFRDHRVIHDGRVVQMCCDYIDVDTGEKKAEVTLLLNKAPEAGGVTLSRHEIAELEKTGLSRHRDAADPANDNSAPVTIKDVLIYHSPLKPKASAPQQAHQPAAPKRRSGAPCLGI